MGDFKVRRWSGDFDSYFAYCRAMGERQRAEWRAEMDEAPPCKHGNRLFVGYQYVLCESCWGEIVA